MSRIAVTGASGFLGRALVLAARQAGAEPVAITRSARYEMGELEHHQVDLAASDAFSRLAPALEDCAAVIHAAASFTGNADTHARDTLKATATLLDAMKSITPAPLLVLVSSFSVYDIAAMEDGETLNEASPTIGITSQRDAYATAKMEQERLASVSGLPLCIVRPGAIYGPGRLWSAQLGFARAGIVLSPDGNTPVPAVRVDHAAQALVRAALRNRAGDVINLVDPEPPTQSEWLTAIGQRAIRVPRAPILMLGRLLGRGPDWSARFRPLRYDTSLAQSWLGLAPVGSFAAAIGEARGEERNAR